MKIFLIQIIMFVSLSLFAQQNNITKNQKSLCQTKTDSADYEIFKKTAEEKIKSNQQKINLLRDKKLNASVKAIKKFNKKIKTLDEKNSELQKRISQCTNVKPSVWTSFKNRFMRDIKKLGEALDDMAVDQYEISQ